MDDTPVYDVTGFQLQDAELIDGVETVASSRKAVNCKLILLCEMKTQNPVHLVIVKQTKDVIPTQAH